MFFCGFFLTSKRQISFLKNQQKKKKKVYSHICFFCTIAHVSLHILITTVWFCFMESKEDGPTLSFFPFTPSSCSVPHSSEAFKPQYFHPSVYLSNQTLKIQHSGRHPTTFFFQLTDIQKAPTHFLQPTHLSIHCPLSSFFFLPFLSEVQTEGTKVAGGIVCVDHCR